MTTADGMALHAAAYCRLIERSAEVEALTLLKQLQPLLAALYTAAVALPEASGSDSNYVGLSTGEHLAIYKQLRSRLGTVDHTREIFDPYGGEAEEPVDVSLSDSLADIYRDVHDGLVIARAGAADDAVWAWKFSFERHWGHHALDALRAIHAYRFSPGNHG